MTPRLTTHPRANGERGAALLVIIIAASVAGILLSLMNERVTLLAKNSQHYDLEEQKNSLALMLREATDCGMTLAPYGGSLAGCNGQWVNLRRSNNGIAVASAGTQVNRWTAVAQCTAGGIQVFAVRPRPGRSALSTSASDFFRDPIADIPQNIARGNAALVYHHGEPPLCTTTTAPIRYRTGRLTWSGNGNMRVNTPFTPRGGICGVSRFDYDDSSTQQCICTRPAIGANFVLFPVQKAGSGGVGCEATYMIFGD